MFIYTLCAPPRTKHCLKKMTKGYEGVYGRRDVPCFIINRKYKDKSFIGNRIQCNFIVHLSIDVKLYFDELHVSCVVFLWNVASPTSCASNTICHPLLFFNFSWHIFPFYATAHRFTPLDALITLYILPS